MTIQEAKSKINDLIYDGYIKVSRDVYISNAKEYAPMKLTFEISSDKELRILVNFLSTIGYHYDTLREEIYKKERGNLRFVTIDIVKKTYYLDKFGKSNYNPFPDFLLDVEELYYFL